MNESARNVLVQHTHDVNCVTIEKDRFLKF